MDDTMIDLGAWAWWARVLIGIGFVVALPVFGSVLVLDLFIGPEELAIRIFAGVFGALILLLCLALWQGRNARPRWLWRPDLWRGHRAGSVLFG